MESRQGPLLASLSSHSNPSVTTRAHAERGTVGRTLFALGMSALVTPTEAVVRSSFAIEVSTAAVRALVQWSQLVSASSEVLLVVGQ